MPVELWTWAHGYLLVLARVGGIVALTPVPGWRHGNPQARTVLALALAAALYPVTRVSGPVVGLGALAAEVLAETAIGAMLGTVAAMLLDGFVVAAQVIGAQAGYSYASTVDPTSSADSTVLQVLAQLTASLLFFATGSDALLLRAMAASFDRFPAGAWRIGWSEAGVLMETGRAIWTVAARIALPVLVLLAMLDLSLAFLGRVHTHLQLLSLAFPVKMIAALALLAAITGAYPELWREQVDGLARLLAGGPR